MGKSKKPLNTADFLICTTRGDTAVFVAVVSIHTLFKRQSIAPVLKVAWRRKRGTPAAFEGIGFPPGGIAPVGPYQYRKALPDRDDGKILRLYPDGKT